MSGSTNNINLPNDGNLICNSASFTSRTNMAFVNNINVDNDICDDIDDVASGSNGSATSMRTYTFSAQPNVCADNISYSNSTIDNTHSNMYLTHNANAVASAISKNTNVYDGTSAGNYMVSYNNVTYNPNLPPTDNFGFNFNGVDNNDLIYVTPVSSGIMNYNSNNNNNMLYNDGYQLRRNSSQQQLSLTEQKPSISLQHEIPLQRQKSTYHLPARQSATLSNSMEHMDGPKKCAPSKSEIYNAFHKQWNTPTTGRVIYTFDDIIHLIRDMSMEDDTEKLNQKIRSIERVFCMVIQNEEMLYDFVRYVNNKALADGDLAMKFPVLFASRNFDRLHMNDTSIRSAMTYIIETNFNNADLFIENDIDRFYNSITLLGNYYHRKRFFKPEYIHQFGEALIYLMRQGIIKYEYWVDERFAKLILSQIVLNGEILLEKHEKDLHELLFELRRCLIRESLTPKVIATLNLTIDIVFGRVEALDDNMDKLYAKYLMPELLQKKKSQEEIKTQEIIKDGCHQLKESASLTSILDLSGKNMQF